MHVLRTPERTITNQSIIEQTYSWNKHSKIIIKSLLTSLYQREEYPLLGNPFPVFRQAKRGRGRFSEACV
jgi:hypothetical protein